MAPEVEVSKRKRSRPSDWWAVPINASTLPQQAEPPNKKRGRTSIRGLIERTEQEASSARNRGKRPQSEIGLSPNGGRTVKAITRGRPSNTKSKLQETSVATVNYDALSKKKRGRPTTGQLEETIAMRSSTKDGTLQRKRGRLAWKGSEAPVENRAISKDIRARASISRPEEPNIEASAKASASEDPKAASRRGRFSNAREGLEADATLGSEDLAGPKTRKRPADERTGSKALSTSKERITNSRPPRFSASIEGSAALAAINGPGLRKRKRELYGKIEGPTVTGASAGQVEQRTTRGGFNTVLEIESASATLTKSGDGRRSRGGPSNEVDGPSKAERYGKHQQESGADILISTQTATRRQKLGTRKTGQAKEKTWKQSKGTAEPGEISSRHNPLHEEKQEAPQAEDAPSYQHLTAVTRRVSRQTIETEWQPLATNCIERISHILSDIQRPVTVRLNDERRRTQAGTVLQMISRRLINKISKGLPFPQGSRNHREDDFDFEKILDNTRTLEGLLTPTLHANELLDSELRKMTVLLEADQETLAELEANAKSEATMWNQAGRKLHSLLQSDDSVLMDEGLRDQIHLAPDSKLIPLSLDDEKLAAVFRVLNGHVDSMESNVSQVEGISQVMARSKAAVQAILFDNLESNQYEDVVLS